MTKTTTPPKVDPIAQLAKLQGDLENATHGVERIRKQTAESLAAGDTEGAILSGTASDNLERRVAEMRAAIEVLKPRASEAESILRKRAKAALRVERAKALEGRIRAASRIDEALEGLERELSKLLPLTGQEETMFLAASCSLAPQLVNVFSRMPQLSGLNRYDGKPFADALRATRRRLR